MLRRINVALLAFMLLVLVGIAPLSAAVVNDPTQLRNVYGQYWPSTFTIETYSNPSTNFYQTRFEFSLTTWELRALRQVEDWLELDFDHRGFDFPNSYNGYVVAEHNLPGGKKDNSWGDGTDIRWEAEYPVPGLTGIQTWALQANHEYYVEIEWNHPTNGSTPKVSVDWVPSHWAGDHSHTALGAPSDYHNAQYEDLACASVSNGDPGWCLFGTVRIPLTFAVFGWSTFAQAPQSWSAFPQVNWEQYMGNIVRWSDGTSWLVEEDGRHWIPTGGDYICFQEYYGAQVFNLSSAQLDAIPDITGDHATCAPVPPGPAPSNPPDADGDGLDNWVDTCPTSWGSADNGCPAVDQVLVGNFDGVGNDDVMLIRSDDGKYDFYVDTNQVANHEIALLNWGLSGDRFLVGQFDGLGGDDIVLVRTRSDGRLDWYFEYGFDTPHDRLITNWGYDTDSTLIGDFNGDGVDDVLLIRFDGSKFDFYIDTDRSRGHEIAILDWGQAGDRFKVGDFDGDGDDDIVLARPDDGKWDFYYELTLAKPHDDTMFNWGLTGDYLHVGDFNDDGQDDLMLVRADDGKYDFYVDTNRSTPHELSLLNWGLTGDWFFTGDFGGTWADDIMLVRSDPTDHKFDWYWERGFSTPHEHSMFNWGRSS